MRKTTGFLLVLLLATITIITTSSGDETDSSHLAHLTAAYGPLVASCDVCHAAHDTGIFADGQDLANTTVCDPCHSPGGAYDGVDDPVIGAKTNWDTGVFFGSELAAGKEMWCVGCHDDDPSVVNGVSAPNMAGDDINYGYFKTGHGKHGNEQAITCLACHDPALMHVDGEARTYAAATDNYQAGYRLKSVDGEAPLEVPRPYGAVTAEQFLLCFSCHDSTPFMNFDNTNTNFRSDVNNSCVALDPLLSSDRVNKHYYHVSIQRNIYDSDFDGVSPDSAPSCPACHNVHGPRLKDAEGITHAPAMIRTGELIGREEALNLEYFVNSCPDTTTSPTNELFDDTGDSTGGSMIYDPLQFQNNWARGGVCGMCHCTNEPYWREAKDIISCGSGNCHTSGSHEAHLTAEYGPLVASCDACHDANSFSRFSDGEDLANTDVCDICHSPGGTYNGVNDLIVGAKDNWVSGVYDEESGGLLYGKEKWCATCHDEEPSVIDGVTAPNIVGDEDNSEGEGKYGGWGFYKTGHGLPGDEPYSYKGGFLESPLKPGASRAVECDACHDFFTVHIDGEPRTFDDSNSAETDPSVPPTFWS